MHVEQAGCAPSHYDDVSEGPRACEDDGIELTLLFRLRQGMQAEETARRLLSFPSEALSWSSEVPGSSLGRSGRGGIT